MNLFEKEKFLKFCDKSTQKQQSMLSVFRYEMTIDPYNVYFLPIFAPPSEIQQWDKEQAKETFFKYCQVNFDEKSYNILSKFNNPYIDEFISTAPQSES